MASWCSFVAHTSGIVQVDSPTGPMCVVMPEPGSVCQQDLDDQLASLKQDNAVLLDRLRVSVMHSG